MNTTRVHSVLGLFGWLMLCFATAAIGAIASVDAAAFYALLHRPSWAPPAEVFGPVWTALYVLIALSAWLVWRAHGLGARAAFTLYVAQLVANALWSWLFFAWHLGALALVDVMLLWTLIVATIVAFWQLRERLACLLLVPYLMWVSFATALTFSVWRDNPALLS